LKTCRFQEAILPKPLKVFVQQMLAERDRDLKFLRAIEHGGEAVKLRPDNGWWRRKSTRRAIFWEMPSTR